MNRPLNFEAVLSKLTNAHKSGNTWIADCPAAGHETPSRHLTLTDTGDKVLVTCQGGRHTYKDICRALGFDSLTYSNDTSTKASRSLGYTCQPVNTAPKRPREKVVSESQSLSVTDLAEEKKLPVDFLNSIGMKNVVRFGNPNVRIPYYDQYGNEVAVRYRSSLRGDSRFSWRKNDHVMPYGLNRLDEIKKAGWVLIVEGESDCWTCWFHNIPVLGAPGKGIWPPKWSEYLIGLQVYNWQEPKAEDFTARILKNIPDLKFIKSPEGIKDISEAHIQGINIPEWLEQLKARAESAKEFKYQVLRNAVTTAYYEAQAVIESPDPLTIIEEEIRNLGYGGDIKPALIAYLAATSRLLEMRLGSMPVHLHLIGPPSAGKSYTLNLVLKLFPEEALHIIDAGSPRTLIYDNAELAHRIIVFGEADSLPAGEDNPAASAIRNLLQDHHLTYEVTVRDQRTGDYTIRKIDKPGPTVLITTSIRPLGHQLMSRLFTFEMSDSQEQIRKALIKQAELEKEGYKQPDGPIITFQSFMQLQAPIRVVVPFAKQLAEVIGNAPTSSRINRDFARLLSLIKSVAILRQHHRETDDEGRIIATIADYQMVRELVNDMYIDSSTGITKEIREMVEVVGSLNSIRHEGKRVTNTAIAKVLDVNVKQVTRWARKAIRAGWLVNREQRKSYPADYELGEPMPQVQGLPILKTENTTLVNAKYDNNDISEVQEVDRLTPVTDGNVPLSQEGWEEVI